MVVIFHTLQASAFLPGTNHVQRIMHTVDEERLTTGSISHGKEKKNYIAEQRRGKRKYLLLGIINALLAGSRDWTNSRGQAVPLLSLWVARPLPASAGVDDDIGSNNPVIAMVNTREPCMGQHHSFHCYLIFINHPFINNDYRGKMTNQFQGILLALA
jgi:hypothetical protein